VESQGSTRSKLHYAPMRVFTDVERSAAVGHNSSCTSSKSKLLLTRAEFVEDLGLVVANAGEHLCDLLPASW